MWALCQSDDSPGFKLPKMKNCCRFDDSPKHVANKMVGQSLWNEKGYNSPTLLFLRCARLPQTRAPFSPVPRHMAAQYCSDVHIPSTFKLISPRLLAITPTQRRVTSRNFWVTRHPKHIPAVWTTPIYSQDWTKWQWFTGQICWCKTAGGSLTPVKVIKGLQIVGLSVSRVAHFH